MKKRRLGLIMKNKNIEVRYREDGDMVNFGCVASLNLETGELALNHRTLYHNSPERFSVF